MIEPTPTPATPASPVAQATPPAPTGEGVKKEVSSAPKTGLLGDTKDPVKSETAPAPTEPKGQEAVPTEEVKVAFPDGVTVDPESLAGFQTLAKEVGLTSESATKLALWNMDIQAKEKDKQHDAWEQELIKDGEFGGKNLEGNVLSAKKALRRFGGEDLAGELNRLGIANLPILVKTFSAIGKALSEDKSDIGGNPNPAPVNDREAQLRKEYPSMFPKQ